LLQELHSVGDSSLACIFVALANSFRVNVNANASLCAEFFNGGDDNSPVTATEIVNHIVFAHLCHPQHFPNNFVGCWDIRDIGRALLRHQSSDDENRSTHHQPTHKAP
jgi:hypothetical protein